MQLHMQADGMTHNRLLRGLIVTLLVTSCFTSLMYETGSSDTVLPKFYVDESNTAGPWDGSSIYPYRYIQDAIDNASAGDRIYVLEGTYSENIVINSSKTSLNLFGEDKENTIISKSSGDVLTISATGVDISDLTIQGGNPNSNNAAVKINASNCVLVNNVISSSDYGVYIYDCDNTKIYYNTISGNSLDGIYIRSSRNNNITYSTIQSNSHNGIFLYNCSNNRLENNTVSSNSLNGIYLNLTCNNNTISNNYIASNSHNGIYLNDQCNDNIIKNHNGNNKVYSNSRSGIRVENSSRNALGHNTVTSNQDYGLMILGSNNTIHNSTVSQNIKHGIFLFGDDNTDILSNTIQNNTKDGIRIQNSTSDVLYKNEISGNLQYGLYINYYGLSNLIYNNYFHENSENAYDMSENNNIWSVSQRTGYNIVNGANTLIAGNYWDDFDNDTEGAYDNNDNGVLDSGQYSINISSADTRAILDIISPTIGTPSATPQTQTIGSYTYISVSITDNTEIEEVRLIVTDPNSDTSNISITQYKTGNTYYYNHKFSTVGNYSYKISARDPRNWVSSSTKTFEIDEGQPPTITDNSPTTGSPSGSFIFNVTVTDDSDSALDLTVKVDWSHGSDSGNYTMTNLNSNYFTKTIPLDNSISSMSYAIYASDQWGNAITTESKTVTITDEEKPEISITKHDYASSGVFSTYTVRAQITDNHNVVNTTITYWYEGSEKQTATMDEKSSNIYEKIIYLDELTDVYCRINTEDPSGNKNNSKNPLSDTGGPYTGIIGVNVEFSGNDSFDLDGTITNYTWNFGDGTTGSGKEVEHKYMTNGNYTITLTVIDNESNTDVKTSYVLISQGEKIEPSASTINQIEQLYNVTLDDDFYAYDTDADNIVDAFIDLNNLLVDIKQSVFNLSGDLVFLISVNDSNVPEFIWNTKNDTIITIKEEKEENIVPLENDDAATATVTIDKNEGWICLHINDEYPYASLSVKADDREIAEDRIWRRDNRVYVLDDPETQYHFNYEGIVIPEELEWIKFIPEEDSTIGESNPTIKIQYNVAVTVEYADFYNWNTSNTIEILNKLETTDYKTYYYTPDNTLPSGAYNLKIEARDEAGNLWINATDYYFASYEEQGFDIISIGPYIIALAGIFVLAFLLSKKFNINFQSFVYVKNKKIIPFFKPVVFGPLSLDLENKNISKAEFYVNGELKDTLTQEPYVWKWDESAFMKQKIETKIYDQEGNSNSSGEMTFYVFNPKLFK